MCKGVAMHTHMGAHVHMSAGMHAVMCAGICIDLRTDMRECIRIVHVQCIDMRRCESAEQDSS